MNAHVGNVATAAASLAVLTALGWGGWVVLTPTPKLESADVAALASQGRFDEGEARVAAYLRSRPDDPSALFLAARMALDRPEPTVADAERAQSYLARIHPESRRAAANVAYYRGKAAFHLSRMTEAERSWRRALDLDPTVPEAAWGLLEVYYVEGRGLDARRLALKQHIIEPDPRDRVLYLLELVRSDYQKMSPAGIIRWAEPVVRKNPDDLRGRLAYGRGNVLVSDVEAGLKLLREAVVTHPDDADAWDAFLTGLEEGGAPDDELIAAVGRLPRSLADQPRFARHLGRAAQEKLDWREAVSQYRRAVASDPGDTPTRYRLARALRNTGEIAEADRIDHQLRDIRAAEGEMAELYESASADKRLGAVPNLDLYRRLADVRERMGRPDEAAAWHRLVLHDAPDDALGLAALKRLETP